MVIFISTTYFLNMVKNEGHSEIVGKGNSNFLGEHFSQRKVFSAQSKNFVLHLPFLFLFKFYCFRFLCFVFFVFVFLGKKLIFAFYVSLFVFVFVFVFLSSFLWNYRSIRFLTFTRSCYGLCLFCSL